MRRSHGPQSGNCQEQLTQVINTGERTSHWVMYRGDKTIEWDSESLADEPASALRGGPQAVRSKRRVRLYLSRRPPAAERWSPYCRSSLIQPVHLACFEPSFYVGEKFAGLFHQKRFVRFIVDDTFWPGDQTG